MTRPRGIEKKKEDEEVEEWWARERERLEDRDVFENVILLYQYYYISLI